MASEARSQTGATLQFGGEEVRSDRTYPAAYAIKPLEQQAAILRQWFPSLGSGNAVAAAALPAGAEGWFVIPRWQALAGSYNAAVEQALAILSRTRDASLSRLDRLGPDRLRQHDRTVAMFEKLRGDTPDGLLVAPAQFGLRHRGRSIRHARELFTDTEVGLGVFAVACMLLTHPERLVQPDQLYVDCAGDEYSSSDEPQFSEAPFFRFIDGRIGFGTSWIGYVDSYFGSATAFVP